MRTIARHVTVATLLCIAALAAQASDPNWVTITASTDNSHAVLLDTNSIKVRGGRLTAWVQDNYVLPEKTPTTSPVDFLSSMRLEAFECDSERSGTVSVTFYSAQHGGGDSVASATFPSQQVQLDYYPPGSIGAYTVESVCRRVQNKTRGPVGVSNPAQGLTSRPSQPESNYSHLVENKYYVNSDGNVIHSPAHTSDGSVPSGASAQCGDGSYSFSQHHQGTCSHHGGVVSWLN